MKYIPWDGPFSEKQSWDRSVESVRERRKKSKREIMMLSVLTSFLF